ncbi:MAG TPA: ORF6N domain-containing protein [Candidatus Udaeobacter sp.]|nr:ORF6N domain-containing protein [Candidatus Udaeobacter sp.]
MSKEIVPIERVVQSIHWIRGQRVLLDSDLAILYDVTTGNLNKAVKRNAGRFPSDFMFQLKPEELANLKFQFGISSWGGRRRSRPYVFAEQGIAMFSSVLNSARAIKVNIAIMRAFVKLRQMLDMNRELARKFSELERRVDQNDEDIAAILEAIRQLMAPPERTRREIGFHVRERTPHYRVRRYA